MTGGARLSAVAGGGLAARPRWAASQPGRGEAGARRRPGDAMRGLRRTLMVGCAREQGKEKKGFPNF
jgi:hypothetical protein